MTIVEKQAVLAAYTQAVHHGATTHEEAVAAAAQATCLPEDVVLEVVWESGHEEDRMSTKDTLQRYEPDLPEPAALELAAAMKEQKP